MSTINMTLRGTMTGTCYHRFDAARNRPKQEYDTEIPITDVHMPLDFSAMDARFLHRATLASTVCTNCPFRNGEPFNFASFSPVSWRIKNSLWAGNLVRPDTANGLSFGKMSRGQSGDPNIMPLPDTPISAGEMTYLLISQLLTTRSHTILHWPLSWVTYSDGSRLSVTHISTGPEDAALVKAYWYVDDVDLEENFWRATFEHRFVLPPGSSLLAGEEESESDHPGMLLLEWEANRTITTGQRLEESDFFEVVQIVRTTDHDEE